MPIQPATPGQLDRIAAIYAACQTRLTSEGIDQWTEEYPTVEITAEDIAAGTLYVLTENDRCLGAINACEEDEPECAAVDWDDRTGRFMVLNRLAVVPEKQREGLGTRLMDFAEEWARGGGYTSVRLLAYAGNPAVLRFYERRGYVRRRGEVCFPGGRRHPFWAFEKRML